jgi:hypothetical protein
VPGEAFPAEEIGASGSQSLADFRALSSC